MTRAAAIAIVVALGAGAARADELPKKLAFLAAKKVAQAKVTAASRDAITRAMKKRVGKPVAEVIQLRNNWTKETLAVEAKPDVTVDPQTWNEFLRCHFTNRSTDMEQRLQRIIVAAALKFKKMRVDVVSGFRAPKFNLMLRKKGHEVARESQHSQGHAVDFRLPGVATKQLLAFVRRIRIGGVGFYPESAFVHADSGPVRNWTGR